MAIESKCKQDGDYLKLWTNIFCVLFVLQNIYGLYY